jgi:hypothetical protein
VFIIINLNFFHSAQSHHCIEFCEFLIHSVKKTSAMILSGELLVDSS